MMQQRLASLGFAMSLEPLPRFNGDFPFDDDDEMIEDEQEELPMQARKTGSSHTAGRSVHNAGCQDGDEAAMSSPHQQRPLKRSRIDSPLNRSRNIHAAPSSRDLMPPPSGPFSRMKSIRKMIPSFRNKFSSERSSTSQTHREMPPDVHMDDDGAWNSTETNPRPKDASERPPTRHGMRIEGGPSMSKISRAKDDGLFHEAAPEPGLLSGLGIHSNDSQFTFEAPSRLKIPDQRSANLPSEPSYMRLLDGLGHHSGLDLGLEDPRNLDEGKDPVDDRREQQMHQMQSSSERRRQTHRAVPRLQTHNQQNRRNFGHAFLEQSPINANFTSAQRYPGLQYARNGDAVVQCRQDGDFLNPATPAPTGSQRPADEVDHVVSPFFGSNSHHAEAISRSQFAEPDISSIRSVTYPSHHHKQSTDVDWREPRGLNGLSFVSSPVNRRNERIEMVRGPELRYVTPMLQRRDRNIDSRGLLVRPDAERSPAHYNDNRFYLGSMQSQSRSEIPDQSIRSPYRSHVTATRLPSAMPTSISNRFSGRQGTGVHGLEKLGVRSSHTSRSHVHGSSSRSNHSRVARRVIRR